MTAHRLRLVVLPDLFAVCRLDPVASLPSWAIAGNFFSITRTADELSVVCHQEAVPEDTACEKGRRCLRVAGTMPFSVVGVLSSLTTPVAEAGISAFAISTFDTDYLLVKEKDLAPAVDVLRRCGFVISS
jgi:hypothetical protein